MRILRRFLARVKDFAMGQRSHEFGIRIAVGATRGNVMAVVFHQGLVQSAVGGGFVKGWPEPKTGFIMAEMA
jgi:hypothetical protein